MDIPRKFAARNRRIRLAILGVVGLAAVVGTSVGLSHLKPAPPEVERATVWPDTVKRGPMVRQVRGLGTLVPEDILWIPSVTEGRVERRLVLPGTPVKPDTLIIELSNPELVGLMLDAERQLKATEADLKNLRVRLETEMLDKKANAATVSSEYVQAKAQAETDEALARNGLITELQLKFSQTKAAALEIRNKIEQQRLAIAPDAAKAQIEAQQAKVDQLRAAYELKRSQVEALKVRAGTEGVLQQLEVQVGQRVGLGSNLARVVDPRRLKAELRIAETQAKDISIGQSASIDTRNGIIPGRVVRIDPAANAGTVGVDVALLADLPPGARPDLSVDGTIELERLNDVIYMGRPAFGQESSTIALFKVEAGGKTAIRVPVKIGRMSVNNVEILDGLKPGDEVILSDMGRWDAFDRIRLR